MFVTHDLGVLTNLADNLIVMQNGEIVEKGTTKEIMTNAKHKHTKFLIGTRRALMEKFKRWKNMINNEILFEVNGITKSYKEKGILKENKKKF